MEHTIECYCQGCGNVDGIVKVRIKDVGIGWTVLVEVYVVCSKCGNELPIGTEAGLSLSS